jgi:two-component system, OmpR family, response regulator
MSVDMKRILVVDDEASVTQVIGKFLRRMGEYEVREVNDASKAVEIASDFVPNLVILDIIMPGVDGGDLLAELRAVDTLSDVPAIFLTGLVSEDEVGQDGYEIGGQPVIAKPVNIEAFRAAVAERLG